MKDDLTGRRFGRLLVLGDSGKRANNRAIKWECQCDCGNIVYIIGKSLKNGDSQSCGCYNKERTSETHIKDLTGQRYGEILLLEPTSKRTNHGSVIWKGMCSCGNIVYISEGDFVKGNNKSCGKCVTKSIGEKKIKDVLDKNDIEYKEEYSFNDCVNPKTRYKLRFDFYLPDYNCCIEYDGEQHFKQIKIFSSSSLEEIQYRDLLKTKYCKNHHIKLVRIPFYDLKKINSVYIKELLSK